MHQFWPLLDLNGLSRLQMIELFMACALNPPRLGQAFTEWLLDCAETGTLDWPEIHGILHIVQR